MSTQYYVVCEFLICNTDLYALLNLTKNLLNLSTAIQSCNLYFQWNFSTHSLIFVGMLCFYCYFVKLSHTKSQVKCKSVVMPQKLNQIKTIHWQISLIILTFFPCIILLFSNQKQLANCFKLIAGEMLDDYNAPGITLHHVIGPKMFCVSLTSTCFELD